MLYSQVSYVSNLNIVFKFRDDREGKRVKRSCEFYDEKLLKNRSVTDLDWSTKVRFHFYSRAKSDMLR
jgi:hypothetical protein